MQKVEEYYDNYVGRQASVGINDRHRSIQRWLLKFGLSKDSKILEIGCGIGTQTELIAKYIDDNGEILAVDISPKSIEVAQKRLHTYKNLKLIAADIINYDIEEQFDVIVMPDVIEHIPLELHSQLFEKAAKLLKKDGFIFIHIPNPYYLEWCHTHRKDALQIIDQPIYTDLLVQNTYPHGLYIHYLESYSIFMIDNDYQAILLKHRPQINGGEKPLTSKKKMEKLKKAVYYKLRKTFSSN